MCCAASFSIVSASSWSLIEGSEIFFTITEWPLTAVATFLVLISFSVNSFEIALETLPESTIIESTTISGASGSRPRCATSIPARDRLSSTALMLEEPTSRPTIVFDPNPNMCPPLQLPGSLGSRLRFLLALGFHLVRLLFHPLVQPRFLEAPAVAQFESGNLLFAYVLVKRVRADSQILRSLANIHHFTRVGHSLIPYPQNQSRSPVVFRKQAKLGREFLDHKCVRVNFGVLSIAQPGQTGPCDEILRFTGFFAVFLETPFSRDR